MTKRTWFHRIAVYLTTMALVLPLFNVTVLGSVFSDIEGSPYQTQVERWAQAGVLKGKAAGYFDADGPVTRAELSAIMSRFNGYITVGTDIFQDVTTDAWYYTDIQKAVAAGILIGTGEKIIEPDRAITREEAIVIFARVFGYYSPDTGTLEGASPWAAKSIINMANAGLLKGLDILDYTSPMTRAEIVMLLDNCAPNYLTQVGTYKELVPGNVVVRSTGVVLEGVTIDGNLIIAEGIGEGEFTVKNTSVDKMLVRGGGENSININGTSYVKNIDASKKGKVAIKINNEAKVPSIYLNDGTSANIIGNTVNLVVSGGSNARIQGKVNDVVINGGSVILANGSSVINMAVIKTAVGVIVNAEKGSNLVSVVSDGTATEIIGDGRVEIVQINGSNSIVATSGTKVTISAEAKNCLVSNKDVEPGKTVTSDGSLPLITGTTTSTSGTIQVNNGAEPGSSIIQVVLSDMVSARFSGLTKISIQAADSLKNLASGNILLKSGEYTVPSSKITVKTIDGNKAELSIDPLAFETSGAKNVTIALKVNGRTGGSVSVEPGAQAFDTALWNKLTKADAGNTGIWHNLNSGVALKAGPAQTVPSNGPNYSQRGKIKATMIVIDFPDARGKDNTGVNALPGRTPVDQNNFINGHRLKTAQDYYDWLMPPSAKFYSTISFGQFELDVKLVKNPNAEDGIFTCEGYLYEKDGVPGYNLDRGGDVNSYLRDGLNVAKKELAKLADEYDLIYVVAVENAVGISYGPMDTWGNTPNSIIGKQNYKALVRIGYDSYSTWKYKGVIHETTHGLGMPDFYLGEYSGPGGGQSDPLTGKADYYSNMGHWDFMGFINGHAPDMMAWNKWRFGWVRDDQVDFVTQNGTTVHEIMPVEIPGGTKMVVIPSDIDGSALVLEYRQKAGVDNLAVTEASNDPSGNPEALWNHNYGILEKPGILLYKVDCNVPTMHGPIAIVNLTPERDDVEFAKILDESVMGSATGIYTYTDPAAGVTITVNPAEIMNPAKPYTVTVEKFDPTDKKPVLSDAHFIDFNTVEFSTSADLRGIMNNKITLKKGNTTITGVKLNQVTSQSVRITFTAGQITSVSDMDNVTVATSAFSFFDAADAVAVEPITLFTAPEFSGAAFQGLNTINALSDVDITGINALALTIKRQNGLTLASSEISSVAFDKTTMTLTINLKPGTFITGNDTTGVKLSTKTFSTYNINGTNIDHAKYRPDVKVFSPGSEYDVTAGSGTVTAVSIVKRPTKYYYGVGDMMDTAGMTAEITYSDSSPAIIGVSPSYITGFDSTTTGVKTVTLSVGGKTDNFEICVVDRLFTGDRYVIATAATSSGWCLDTNGTKLYNWWNYTYDYPVGTAGFVFETGPTSGGINYYYIKNTINDVYVQSTNASMLSVTTTKNSNDNSGNGQHWQIIGVNGGKYVFVNRLSGKAMNVGASSTVWEADTIPETAFDPNDIKPGQLWSVSYRQLNTPTSGERLVFANKDGGINGQVIDASNEYLYAWTDYTSSYDPATAGWLLIDKGENKAEGYSYYQIKNSVNNIFIYSNESDYARVGDTPSGDAYLWRLVANGDHYAIVNKLTGKALGKSATDNDHVNNTIPETDFNPYNILDTQLWALNLKPLAKREARLFVADRYVITSAITDNQALSSDGSTIEADTYVDTVGSMGWALEDGGYDEDDMICYYKLKNLESDKYLVDDGDGNLSMAADSGDNGGLWRVVKADGSNYAFINVKSTKALNYDNGTISMALSSVVETSQQWSLTHVPQVIDGTEPGFTATEYYILNKVPNALIDGNGFVRGWNWVGGGFSPGNAAFVFENAGVYNGTYRYRIVSKLNLANCAYSDGSGTVKLGPKGTNGTAEMWEIVNASDDYSVIINLATGKALTMPSSGAILETDYDANDIAENQLWKIIEYVAPGGRMASSSLGLEPETKEPADDGLTDENTESVEPGKEDEDDEADENGESVDVDEADENGESSDDESEGDESEGDESEEI